VFVYVCKKYNASLPKRDFLMRNAHRITTTANRLTLNRRHLTVQVYT
jgi:hypothetical protein